MKTNLKLLTITITFLISCTKTLDKKEFVGDYSVNDLTLADKIFLKIKQSDGRILGSELSLFDNNKFTYSTCGNIMTGLWSISKDDIKLQIQNNKYRVDSLQREKGHLLTPTIIYFQIRDRQLFREWKFQDRTMTIELLTKR